MPICVFFFRLLNASSVLSLLFLSLLMDSPSLSHSSSFSPDSKKETWKHTLLLSFQSLGVVYGRLSIAPLYVFGTISAADIKSEEGLFGLLSFVFWTMTIIPLLKYAFIVLRADDNGEGGTFALYSLLCRHAKVGLLPNQKVTDEVSNFELGSPSKTKSDSKARRAIEKHKSSHYLMLFLALFGSCMVIGDGVLTPALSVLSASSGLERSLLDISYQFSSSPKTQESISKALKKYVPVPTACAMLIGLFMLQKYGTHKIGFIFAPIIILWLLLIGGVGLYNIFYWNRRIVYAASPEFMYKFIRNIDIKSWRSLGSILLCIAGSEAMFANLGHFSKKSIKITFIFLIYPVLMLSYAGEAAFISKNPLGTGYITDFGRSMPKSLHHVFTVLSLLASAVGSQATITATFSIINQCQALGCFPRVKVIHTSDKIQGQVYIPDMNWVLMVLSLAVTIGFRDIGRIGNAAGLAIISGMLITTCLMSLIIALYWERNISISACFLIFFGFIEAMYLSACLLSFQKGAWYLVILLVISMTSMLAWHYGTKKKYEFDLENKVSMEWLTDFGTSLGVTRIPGIGFIYTDIVTGIPAFFSHFVTNLPAFHQVLIFVSFKSVPVPCVPPRKRYLIGRVGTKEYRVYRCVVRYGYCDRTRDTDDFEEQLISMIAEFISMEENDTEALTSPEGKMVFIENAVQSENVLIPLNETNSNVGSSSMTQNGSPRSQLGEQRENASSSSLRKKKVKFLLPPEKAMTRDPVRKELQELVNARESGTAYFLGQSHLSVRNGSSVLKKILIMIYVFLDKNCRESPVALNIPHAALVEVGMVYTI